jgi:hypothetical protein
MSSHHRAQVLALLGNGLVHAPSQLVLTACSLARRRLALVSRRTMNLPFLVLPQQCVKPRKSKVSGLPCPSAASVLPGEAPELDQPRLLRVQLQPELAQPLGHRALEALGIIRRYSNPATQSSA